MHSALARRELCQLAGKLGRRTITQPRNVCRRGRDPSSDPQTSYPLELAGSSRGCASAADRNSRRRPVIGWHFVVAMVVMGKYPPTRRIRTNNDLPAPAALCAPQPAAAFLGGRRLARNPFFVAGLELKRELVAGDLRDPVDDLIAIVIIAVVYTTAPGCLIERRTSRSRGRSWARGSSSSSACAVAIGRWIHGRRRSIDGRIRY